MTVIGFPPTVCNDLMSSGMPAVPSSPAMRMLFPSVLTYTKHVNHA